MNKFINFCFALAIACFIACFVSACVGTFHADSIDWKTERSIENEND